MSTSRNQPGRAWRARWINTRVLAVVVVSSLWILSVAAGARAQEGPVGIRGSIVIAGSGEPVQNAAVFIEGRSRSVLTNASGVFEFLALPAGSHTLAVERLGFATVRREVSVEPASVTHVVFEMEAQAIQVAEVVVTATREARSLNETAASVGVIGREALEAANPSHPSEIMNHIAGVWVNVTGGEGHMTAIRQPLTTEPVYLFLEDGVPTRSTGFFNHNALYEVNIPQSQRIEVMKGPANALYGSDAIGGVINVATRTPSLTPTAELTVEGGEHGYGRLLASGSSTFGDDGVRADLNLVRTDGWREGTAYDRVAGTIRWDRSFGGGISARTLLSLSFIDQSTAGSSALSRADYLDNPTLNYTPISFREVGAVRLSSELQKEVGVWSVSLTPFYRSNSMDILPNWSLTYDPAVWETSNQSLGFLARIGRDFPDAGLNLIGGVDVDFSPGAHVERRVDPTRQGSVFTSYAVGDRLYDYDVTFRQVSPYLHADLAPTERLNLTVGLRGDFMGYDYRNGLAVVTDGSHRRPPDASPTFRAVSPKFGLTYSARQELNLFAAARKGFRAPSEGDLFRQGSAENTLGLEPVKTWSYETGLRGVVGGRFSYDLALYTMTKTDDILGFQRPDGNRETVNAGETRHRGVELALGVSLHPEVRVDVAYSVAKHTYEEWQPEDGVDFAGNEMEFAPSQIGNVGLSYRPAWLPGSRVSLEWTRVGPYWEDQQNEHEYEGHDLLNLDLRLRLLEWFEVFAHLANLADDRYAERASYNAFRGEELAPGLPRTLRLGVTVR